MMIRILLIMLLAVIISDYYLQKPRTHQIWTQIRLKSILMSWLRFFAPLSLLFLIFGVLTLHLFIIALVLPILYIIVNYVMGKMDNWHTKLNKGNIPFPGYRIYLFLLEQFLKVSLIILAYCSLDSGKLQHLANVVMEFLVGPAKMYDSEVKLLFIAIVLMSLIRVSSHFVSLVITDLGQGFTSNAQQEIAATSENHPIIEKFIQTTPYAYSKDFSIEESLEFREKDLEYDQLDIVRKVSKQHNNYVSDPNSMGTYIGIIERILIAFFVVNSAFTAIAFIGAVKTLARFKQFEDRRFAEYYLLGTLLSALFGFAGGFLMTRVL
jgi:hypothetical protein